MRFKMPRCMKMMQDQPLSREPPKVASNRSTDNLTMPRACSAGEDQIATRLHVAAGGELGIPLPRFVIMFRVAYVVVRRPLGLFSFFDRETTCRLTCFESS